jgi:hypothetical protein
MKSVSLVAVLLIGVAINSSVNGQDFEVKCRSSTIKLTADHLKLMNECLGTLGVKSVMELSPSTAGCFGKCLFEKEGLLDGEGKPHKENIMKAMDDGLPADLVEPWKKEMEICLDTDAKSIKVPDDANCSSYMPAMMCFHMAYFKICK